MTKFKIDLETLLSFISYSQSKFDEFSTTPSRLLKGQLQTKVKKS